MKKKKTAYGDSRVVKQRSVIAELKKENATLRKQVEKCQKIISDRDSQIEQLTAVAMTANESYSEMMESLRQTKNKYDQTLKDINDERKKYRAEMTRLIKDLKKRVEGR